MLPQRSAIAPATTRRVALVAASATGVTKLQEGGWQHLPGRGSHAGERRRKVAVVTT